MIVTGAEEVGPDAVERVATSLVGNYDFLIAGHRNWQGPPRDDVRRGTDRAATRRSARTRVAVDANVCRALRRRRRRSPSYVVGQGQPTCPDGIVMSVFDDSEEFSDDP